MSSPTVESVIGSGKTFTKRQYDKKATSSTTISAMNDVVNFLINSVRIKESNIANAIVAGGAATHSFMSDVLQKDINFTNFGDIDIYVNSNEFNEIKSWLALSTEPTIKLKYIEIINKTGWNMSQVCDSFDLSHSKCMISSLVNPNIIWFDERLMQLKDDILCLDHETCGHKKAFERLEKYIKRWDFKHVSMPAESLLKYNSWKESTIDLKEDKTTELFNENGKELCLSCPSTELKWIHMQLKCPSCKRVYAG
jgi:hypothetical protein